MYSYLPLHIRLWELGQVASRPADAAIGGNTEFESRYRTRLCVALSREKCEIVSKHNSMKVEGAVGVPNVENTYCKVSTAAGEKSRHSVGTYHHNVLMLARRTEGQALLARCNCY